MPSTDWIPVILAYGRKFGDNGLLEFSQKVACKNIADAVCGKSPSYRIDHLNSIIHLIEESGNPPMYLTLKDIIHLMNMYLWQTSNQRYTADDTPMRS